MTAVRGTPAADQVTGEAIESALLNLRVASIGIVQDYDAEEQTCTVQPAIKRPLETVDGEVVQYTPSLVQNVMVAHFGSAALSVHSTLAKGDAVLLVYLDYSPALWRERGKLSDAAETTKHGPSYPVAIPFLRPSGAAGPDQDLSIGEPSGTRVHFESGVVRVGPTTDPAADFVALAAKVNARLDALETQVTLPHTSAAPGSPTVPPVFVPGGGDVSASKLKTG